MTAPQRGSFAAWSPRDEGETEAEGQGFDAPKVVAAPMPVTTYPGRVNYCSRCCRVADWLHAKALRGDESAAQKHAMYTIRHAEQGASCCAPCQRIEREQRERLKMGGER